MKVLNLIWGFTLGGVGKCFLTYAGLGAVDSRLRVHSVCINLLNTDADLEALKEHGVEVVAIRNRRDASWVGRVNQIVRREKPDLTFTHGFNGPVVVMLCRLFGGPRVPFVCSYHSEYHPMTKSRRVLAPILNGTMHFIHRHFAQSVLCVAKYNVDFLSARGVPRSKLAYVYNGIADVRGAMPKPKGYPSFAEDAVVFLVASRLDAIKGLHPLIMALGRVSQKYPKSKMIVVGEGPDGTALKADVEDLGLSECVRFVGYQSNVANWMAHCDVFCLPSFIESFPVGLVEAMCAGKPSIVSRVGGIPEAVTSAEAIFINPGDVDQISEAMERLLEEPSVRQRYGSLARERYLAMFTEEKMKRGIADWLLSQGAPNA